MDQNRTSILAHHIQAWLHPEKSYGSTCRCRGGELVFLFAAGAGFYRSIHPQPGCRPPNFIGWLSKQVKRSLLVFQSAYFFIEFSSIRMRSFRCGSER